MSLTVEDVQRWDPGAVRDVGDAARTRAQTSIDTAISLPTFPDWTGPGSEEAKQAIERTRQSLMKDADAATAAARSADTAAANVQIFKDNLQHVLNMARELGMVVDPVAGSVRPALETMALPNDWHNAEVLQQAIQQVLAQANTVDEQLAAAMDQADDVVDVPPEARPIPLPDASTEDVDQWWRELSQKDRERLIAEHPAELGNLNGIPAAARDAINQQVIADDLNTVANIAAQHGVSKEQVLANPDFYGLSAEDVTRYGNAVKVQQGLDHQRGSDPNPSRQRPVMLWRYEPLADRGQGRADCDRQSGLRRQHDGHRAWHRQQCERWLAQRRPQRRDEPVGSGQRGRPEQHPLGDLVDGLRRARRVHRRASCQPGSRADRRRLAGRRRQRPWSDTQGLRTAYDGDRALLRVDNGGRCVRPLRYARQRCGPIGLPGN